MHGIGDIFLIDIRAKQLKNPRSRNPAHFLVSQSTLFVASNVFLVGRRSGLSFSLSLFNLAILHSFTFSRENGLLTLILWAGFAKTFIPHSFYS